MKPIKFIFTTRHGTFFHLTPTNLSQLDLRHALVSIGDFAHMEGIFVKLQEKNISFKKYLGLQEKMNTIYLTAVDSYKPRCIEGTQLSMTVKLKQDIGFRLYTIDQHNKLADLIKPDILVSLTETPSEDTEAGIKSNKRAVEKSLFFLDNTLKFFKDKEKKPKVYAAIQGGLNLELRQLSMYYTIQACFKEGVPLYDNFGGFVFYGLSEGQEWDERDEIVEALFEEVPTDLKEDLSFVLAGRGDLLSVIWGTSWGFDGFEVEEPFTLASTFKALHLPQIHEPINYKELNKYQGDPLHFFELTGKKIPLQNYPIKDAEHIPIDDKCTCFSCKNHTQLYITHLLECHEMNAQVLLSIHNTHQYQTFYRTLTQMREQKQQNQWFRWLLSTLGE